MIFLLKFSCFATIETMLNKQEENFVKNPQVELTIENWLTREGCPRTYKYIIKLTLNLYGTLGS